MIPDDQVARTGIPGTWNVLHDLKVMGSNPGHVKLGVRSSSKSYLNKKLVETYSLVSQVDHLLMLPTNMLSGCQTGPISWTWLSFSDEHTVQARTLNAAC